jgi:hypothetical protein
MENAGIEPVDEAVRAGDLDELLRLVDRCCDARDWDALARLRERCRRAHETGRQLWPAAAHASYRLALDAPAPFAAAVLEEGEGRFALGPLPEVAAQHHTWEELAPHVPAGAPAVVTAHERVVRGEDCTSREPSGPPVLDLPLRLTAWEPRYAVAEYAPDRAQFPTPPLPALAPVGLPAAREPEVPDDAVRALLDLVRTWTSQSDGHADAVTVRGGVVDAIATLGATSVRGAPVDASTALAWLAWAGASSGARGRRPGAAAGRFAAWWAVAAVVEMTDDWPPDDERLGDELARLRWLAWDDQARGTGWRLQLAAEDPSRGRAWAVTATDSA